MRAMTAATTVIYSAPYEQQYSISTFLLFLLHPITKIESQKNIEAINCNMPATKICNY